MWATYGVMLIVCVSQRFSVHAAVYYPVHFCIILIYCGTTLLAPNKGTMHCPMRRHDSENVSHRESGPRTRASAHIDPFWYILKNEVRMKKHSYTMVRYHTISYIDIHRLHNIIELQGIFMNFQINCVHTWSYMMIHGWTVSIHFSASSPCDRLACHRSTIGKSLHPREKQDGVAARTCPHPLSSRNNSPRRWCMLGSLRLLRESVILCHIFDEHRLIPMI